MKICICLKGKRGNKGSSLIKWKRFRGKKDKGITGIKEKGSYITVRR